MENKNCWSIPNDFAFNVACSTSEPPEESWVKKVTVKKSVSIKVE